ncbi:MAG: M1 family peptidase [Gemmatimonas sp.]|nr:M1 family peptidase [Gemmatimonas sp.]
MHGRALRPFLILFLILAASEATSQEIDIYDSGGPILPEQADFDVTFYEITLEVEPEEQRLDGWATTVARLVEPSRTIVLDLDTLFNISRVTEVGETDERDLSWERRGGRIWIDLGTAREAGSDVAVRVFYSGRPRVAPQAPWDGGFVWAETEAGAPWIATAVQGEGPDVWWPAKDHVSDKPDSLALHITVPEPLVVAANGSLQSVRSNGDGTSTYDFLVSTPISAYNVALNIAPYILVEGEIQSVGGEVFPVTFYALPEDGERARAFLPEVLDHLSFYEGLLGPYPFRADGYKVAQTPHLGMEHQTVIAYGADFDRGAMTGGRDWGFDALHHHELAHEWWGNLVTNADWKDMWLHEGFGTYMQSLYAERLGGEELYLGHLLNERQLIGNQSPVAPRESRTSGQIYFDSGGDIYSKGAWILHTLRWLIGGEAMLEALRRMAYPTSEQERITTGEQTRFATTDDFLDLVERIAGQDLDWFFEVYLRQPALPSLSTVRTGNTLRLEWETPQGLPFHMPVEVEIDGERRRVEMHDGRAELAVPVTAVVTIDPKYRVLRENQAPINLPPG